MRGLGGAWTRWLCTEAASDAQKWVQNIVDLKDQFDVLLERVLAKDKSFQTVINDVRRRCGGLATTGPC